jgi:hypothetical protein
LFKYPDFFNNFIISGDYIVEIGGFPKNFRKNPKTNCFFYVIGAPNRALDKVQHLRKRNIYGRNKKFFGITQ